MKNLFASGFYLGGGGGFAYQDLSTLGSSDAQTTTSIRAFAGYQLFSLMGVEAGYTYFTPGASWNNLGQPSATIYDLSVIPGFSIPLTQITLYGRFGVDFASPGFNDSWTNQLTGAMHYSLEWGGGLKFSIPITGVFVRAEYINYGTSPFTNNQSVNVGLSTAMLELGYEF